MTKGLPRSLGRNRISSAINKMVLPIRALAITPITGASGVGWGTIPFGDFPEGNILVHGAAIEGTLTKTTAGIVTTFTATLAVGSAPTADLTLSGAEVDIIPATAQAIAVASVAPLHALSTAASSGVVLDNTDGTLELNLNLTLLDADINADAQIITCDAVFVMSYTVLADN